MGPKTLILHTKFQGDLSTGSGEVGFLNDFTINEHGSHIYRVIKLILQTSIIFISLFLKAFLRNLVMNSPVVSEKKQLLNFISE